MTQNQSQSQRPHTWVSPVATAALVAVFSYTLQRLWDSRSEAETGLVLATATIPYFWRIALSALHGLSAGALLRFAPDATRAWVLVRLPTLTWVLAIGCGAAMLLVP